MLCLKRASFNIRNKGRNEKTICKNVPRKCGKCKSFWIQILMLNKNKLVIEITTTPLSNNILPFVGA